MVFKSWGRLERPVVCEDARGRLIGYELDWILPLKSHRVERSRFHGKVKHKNQDS